MKKIIAKNNKFSCGKKPIKKKVDKNTVYAFILLGFFVFWTIGSIFGIFAYAKKVRHANIISASANVVTEFEKQHFSNISTYRESDGFSALDGYVSIAYGSFNYPDSYGDSYINIAMKDNVGRDGLLCPLWTFLLDWRDYHEQSIFIAFVTDFDFPRFYINSYSEGAIVDEFSFTVRSLDGSNNFIHYSYVFLEDYNEYFFGLSSDDVMDNEIYNLYNFQIFLFPEFKNYEGYAYTYNEFVAMYESELYASYLEGIRSTDSYDIGFKEGFDEAINLLNNSLNGIFSTCDWDISVNTITHDNVTYNGFFIERFRGMRFSGRNTVDLYASMISSFNEVDISNWIDFQYNAITFTAYNFQEVIPSILSFTYEFQNNVTIEQVQRYFNDRIVFVDSNNYTYWNTVQQVTPTSYNIVFDFSSMLEGATLERMELGYNIASLIMFEPLINDSGVQYGIGFDIGYNNGYSAALNNYSKELENEYNKGLESGIKFGYADGYSKGVEDSNNYTFTSLISSVVDVPIRAFTSLFNFEILGINLANFFFALLTICLVLAIIKLVI